MRADENMSRKGITKNRGGKGSKISRITILSSIVVVTISVFGLLGYLPGLRLFSSVRGGYIPMAPSTAISFLLLTAILLVSCSKHIHVKIVTAFSIFFSAAISVFGLLKSIEYIVGVEMSFEENWVGLSDKLGDVPVGIMSSATGGLFVLSGIASLLLVFWVVGKQKQKIWGSFVLLLSSMTFTGGLLFLTAYMLGQPFLYNLGRTVPMALTTAVSFLFLGVLLIDIARVHLRFDIRTKLLTSTVVILLFLLSINVFTLQNVSALAITSQKIIDHPLTVIRAAVSAEVKFNSMHAHMKDVVISFDEEERARYISLVDQSQEDALKQLDIVQSEILGEEGEKLAADVRQAFVGWQPIRKKIIDLMESGEFEKAQEITKNEEEEYVDSLGDKIELVHEYSSDKSISFSREAAETTKKVVNSSILAIVLGGVSSIVFAVLLSLSFVRRLTEIKQGSIQMAKGNLAYRVDVKGDDEIGELATAFNQMAQDLQSITASRDELNQLLRLLNKILRHDILNNLTVIMGNIDLYFDHGDKVDLDETLHEAHAALEKAVGFIRQMKELETAIASGKALEQTLLSKVISDVQNNFKDLKFSISGDGTVMADDALTSVVSNIVSNAQVHGGSEIIDINIKQVGEMVELRIADEGTGVPDEIKGKVFKEGFKHGESGNSGLGLYIVKKTIERYGGTVAVEDNEPKGAVFVLKIPKAG